MQRGARRGARPRSCARQGHEGSGMKGGAARILVGAFIVEWGRGRGVVDCMSLSRGTSFAASIRELCDGLAFLEACLDAADASKAAHMAWHAAVVKEAAAEIEFLQKMSDIHNIKAGSGQFNSS